MIIETILQAVAYATTIIATLRAGSRAIYAMHHNNEIGIMDGPLILSPQDVADIKRRRQEEYGDDVDVDENEDEISVSPLWESAYAFSEAVRLLHDADQITEDAQSSEQAAESEDTNGEMNQTATGLTKATDGDGDVLVGNWKREEETKNYYSFASPQKTFSKVRSVRSTLAKPPKSSEPSKAQLQSGLLLNEVNEKNNTNIENASKDEQSPNNITNDVSDDDTDSDSDIDSDSDSDIDTESEENDERQMVPFAPYTTPKSIQQMCNMSSTVAETIHSYCSDQFQQTIEKVKTISSIWKELWMYHPLLGENPYFAKKRQRENMPMDVCDDDDDDDQNGVGSSFGLDFDTFYTKSISLPKPPKSNELIYSSGSNGRNDGANTPAMDRVAQVKAYAPRAFMKLRKKFGVSEDAFTKSLLRSGPYVSFQSNSKGAARVGGFFFFSRDGAYMIKTIKKAEIKAILEMLPKYYNFMKRNSRKSLLTRFCGLYSVKLGDAERSSRNEEEERFFLIMNSVFPAEGSMFISERYDLKGSTVGRACSKEERETKGTHAVLKDLDLAKEVEVMRSLSPSFTLPDCGICIGPTAKAALLSQLRKDLSLLVECQVMDYSLLVGIVNMEYSEGKSNTVKEEIERLLSAKRKKGKWRNLKVVSALATPIELLGSPAIYICEQLHNAALSTLSTVLTLPFPYYGAGTCGVDGGSLSILHGRRLGRRAIYYMGVIDFLQPWTTQKVLEKELKGVLGYDKTAISCVDPREYAERFLDFMDKNIT